MRKLHLVHFRKKTKQNIRYERKYFGRKVPKSTNS